MAGFPLSGIDPNDPTPGLLREIRVAQGTSFGSGGSRDVVFLGTKTSAGSETVDTLGDPIVDESNCIARFGVGSEIHLMYRVFNINPQAATIYAVAVTAGSGNGTVDFTITNAATANSTFELTVIGEKLQVGVQSDDSTDAQKANIILAVNRQLHWPVVASSGGVGIVRLTTKCGGTRHDYHLTRSRAKYLVACSSSVAKSAVTPAGSDDDQTAAIVALEAANIYYAVNCKSPTAGPTATDNGIGEHSVSVSTQVLPINGKSMVGIAGLTGTQAQATTVATASAANNPDYFFYHAENNDWSGAMIAAHMCGAKRSGEIAHKAKNLTGFGTKTGQICAIPDPFDKNDRPTATEIRADLNNGVCPIAFTSKGASFLVRDVTSRSWSGSSATNDYRAREGHIPSVMFELADQILSAYRTTAQDFVDADPAEGQRVFEGVTYPRDAKSLIGRVIDNMISTPGGPLLAPSQADSMKASAEVLKIAGGISAHVRAIAVEHNLKGQFLLDEAGAAY